MSKVHNYHDYKAPKPAVIPDDLNELPLKTAEKLDPSGDFKKFMHSWQSKKLFGDLNFIDPKDGRLHASFEFHSGMCKKFKLIRFMEGSSTHGMQTIINPNVNFKRDAK